MDKVKNGWEKEYVLVYTEFPGTDIQMASVYAAVSIKELMRIK